MTLCDIIIVGPFIVKLPTFTCGSLWLKFQCFDIIANVSPYNFLCIAVCDVCVVNRSTVKCLKENDLL